MITSIVRAAMFFLMAALPVAARASELVDVSVRCLSSVNFCEAVFNSLELNLKARNLPAVYHSLPNCESDLNEYVAAYVNYTNAFVAYFQEGKTKDDQAFFLSNTVSLETQRHFAKLEQHWSYIAIESFRYPSAFDIRAAPFITFTWTQIERLNASRLIVPICKLSERHKKPISKRPQGTKIADPPQRVGLWVFSLPQNSLGECKFLSASTQGGASP
jgi:hypothetical protein